MNLGVNTGMHGPTILDQQPITAVNRKRRMDWEPLDESPNSSHDATPEPKIPNLIGKERDRSVRRGQGEFNFFFCCNFKGVWRY